MLFPTGDGLCPKELMGYYKFLWKVEELNDCFEAYLFVKEYGLINATREFFEKHFPQLKLPELPQVLFF